MPKMRMKICTILSKRKTRMMRSKKTKIFRRLICLRRVQQKEPRETSPTRTMMISTMMKRRMHRWTLKKLRDASRRMRSGTGSLTRRTMLRSTQSSTVMKVKITRCNN
jgi:hypothetical protein